MLKEKAKGDKIESFNFAKIEGAYHILLQVKTTIRIEA